MIDQRNFGLRRQGVVLFLVVSIILMMTLLTYGFLISMRTQNLAAAQAGERIQARQAAFSARELVCLLMESPLRRQYSLGGMNSNELLFRQVAFENAREDEGEWLSYGFIVSGKGERRYGVDNLSAKIDLNRLLLHDQQQPGFARECLMRLPNMTESIADHILDWIDSDDEAREFGAESGFYLENSMTLPRNAVPFSLAELVHIPEVTSQLLFGFSAESDGLPSDDLASSTENVKGWSQYLTVRAGERNEDFDGNKRVFLNSSDLFSLHAQLAESINLETANFVVLARQNGLTQLVDDSTAPTRNASEIQIDFTIPARHNFETVLDIFNGVVQIGDESSSPDEVTSIKSPFMMTSFTLDDQMEKYLDSTTTTDADVIDGRVNLLLASREALLSVPGIDEALAEQVMANREGQINSAKTSFWLLANGLVNIDQMKRISPFVTVRGEICHLVYGGWSDSLAAPLVYEACLDATSGTSQLIESRRLFDVGRFKEDRQNTFQDQ